MRTPKKIIFTTFCLAMACSLGLLAACGSASSGDGGSTAAQTSKPGADFVWTMDSDCGSCHTGEHESAANAADTYSKHSGTPCVTCHTDDGGKLSKAHEDAATAKLPKKLKATTVSPEACLSCHSQSDLAASTSSSKVLTDKKGTVVNPHAIPATATHTANVTCVNCHSMHSDKPRAEAATEECASCHHAGVYECGTCHAMK